MGDYANYGRALLGAIGILYVIASVVALVLALWLPKSLSVKMFMAGMVIVLVSILPIQVIQEIRVQRGKASEFKRRCEKTRALFDERCKTAGEKIYRTVEEVESIALVNLKKKRDSEWEFEQFIRMIFTQKMIFQQGRERLALVEFTASKNPTLTFVRFYEQQTLMAHHKN